MHEAPSAIRLVVPQPQPIRSVYLAIATAAFFLGIAGGIAGTTEAGIVWWITAAGWFLYYLWTRLVPYLSLTPDHVVIAASPFSPAGASLEAPFDVVAKHDAIELRHSSGSTDRILLDRVPAEVRPRLIAGLRDLAARAAAREQRLHEEFIATWGVDPTEVDGSLCQRGMEDGPDG